MPAHRSRLLAANDPVLAQYLSAADEECRSKEMERILIERVQPSAWEVLGSYVRDEWPIDRDDADDIVGQVTLNVVRKLRAATVLEEESVQSLDAYVVTLTRNMVRDYLRRRTPEHTRLKSRLKYVFSRDARLALWSEESVTICGLASWGERAGREKDVARVRAAIDGPMNADTLVAAFTRIGKPVRLSMLLSALPEDEEPPEEGPQAIEIATVSHGDEVEARQFLEILWREIRALPQRQQTALLLNLREPGSGNAVLLFLTVRIASFQDIADALELSADELNGIWEELPLDDLRIATHLGITRQQVINLRKSARERLTRRMGMQAGRK